jgi:hypothetical protein
MSDISIKAVLRANASGNRFLCRASRTSHVDVNFVGRRLAGRSDRSEQYFGRGESKDGWVMDDTGSIRSEMPIERSHCEVGKCVMIALAAVTTGTPLRLTRSASY